MRNIALLLLFGLLINQVAGQSNLNIQHAEYEVEFDQNKIRTDFSNVQYRTVCAVDTVYYTSAKATNTKVKTLYSNGTYASSYGQMFRASQYVTIQGFNWYGYSYDSTGTTNPIIDVECSVYLAGSDSLPTGTPLATQTIQVDSSTANMEHTVIFPAPAVINWNYVIVITNNSANELHIISNDESANDGQGGEYSFSFWEPNNAWIKNENLWALGDYDFLFSPIVKYSLDASFIGPSSGEGCTGDASNFQNNSSWVGRHWMYNTDVFYGNPISYHWDYGDGNTDSFMVSGHNLYAAPGTYTITLTDTLFGWTTTCVDLKISPFVVHETPLTPTVTPPAPVCELTNTIGPLIATGSGGTMTWYSDAALTTVVGTGSPFQSNYTQNATLYVTETNQSCEGGDTSVNLVFLTNPEPTFNPNYLNNQTYEFIGAPTANVYNWDFGDGSPIDNSAQPTHTFPGITNYNVCLSVDYANSCSNDFCSMVNFVGIEEESIDHLVTIYPSPNNGFFTIKSDKNTNGAIISIHDVIGKQHYLKTLKGPNSIDVDLTELPKGLYFVTLQFEDRAKTTKKVLIR